MADAQDLKSWDRKKSCRFESDHRHQNHLLTNGIKVVINSHRIHKTARITLWHNKPKFVHRCSTLFKGDCFLAAGVHDSIEQGCLLSGVRFWFLPTCCASGFPLSRDSRQRTSPKCKLRTGILPECFRPKGTPHKGAWGGDGQGWIGKAYLLMRDSKRFRGNLLFTEAMVHRLGNRVCGQTEGV